MRMKIAYVINTIGKNGPGRVVLSLIESLDKSKYTPALITLFSGDDEEIVKELRRKGIQVTEIRYPGRIKFLLWGYLSLGKKLSEGHFEIVHSHGFIPDTSSARLRNINMRVTTVHNDMAADYAFEYGKLRGRFFTLLHRHALKKLDTVAGCSEAVCRSLWMLHRPTVCIRNGLDIKGNGCLSREQTGLPGTAVVFIYVGAFTQRKNVRELAELFTRNHSPEEYLLMVGDGPELENCRRISDAHVVYTGFQESPMEYMNISDIYISASKAEGFPIAVVEALGCGLQLLLSDILPHREIFRIGRGIYLGEYFTKADFEKKLQRLRRGKRTEKQEIKDFQRQRLSAKAMAEQYQKLYGKREV